MKVPDAMRIESVFDVNESPDFRTVAAVFYVDQYWSRQDWLNGVLAWREVLAPRKETVWGLYHDDAGQFSVILFALWSLGKTACLPGSCQPALLRQLGARVEAFVGDFNGVITPTVKAPLTRVSAKPDGNGSDVNALRKLTETVFEYEAPRLQIFTSGSSGYPQIIDKNLSQLVSEVAHLEALWGNLSRQALVVSTVSHQHIYGLLFRVLWPLLSRRCFDATCCEYLEDVAIRRATLSPLILISSPAHLSRIPESLESQALHAVFSSGAPLMQRDSVRSQQRFGVAVTEVYGSSETGGIAWRQQTSVLGDAWQTLPGVSVRAGHERCLEVRSAHLPDQYSWVQTADRASFDDAGYFVLNGRADRIVKIEGKRLSLDEMEFWLLEHEDIRAVRLVVLHGRRDEVGAVLVLSASANEVLNRDGGKQQVQQRLRQHVLACFERPLVPRRWRYVDKLPCTSQGKFRHADIAGLFLKTPSVDTMDSRRIDQALTLPVELECVTLPGGSYRLALRVPENLLYFEGHFPETPILPGVVMVHWAEHFARRLYDIGGVFLRLEVVKFQKVVTPGLCIFLDIEYSAEQGKVKFSFGSREVQYVSGRIVFGAAA